MKYLRTFESYNDLYTEIEFVCYNSVYGGTDKNDQNDLFLALKLLDGVLVYKQDFSEGEEEQISLAVIILDKSKEETLHNSILDLAKLHNVEVDITDYKPSKVVDQIMNGTYDNNIIL